MAVTEIDVEKAALFHDIGKVYQRAGKLRKSHSLVGKEVLAPFFDTAHEAILRAIAYHHGADLEKAALPADDISYIIYEADNLAAASDRRSAAVEGEQDTASGQHFVSTLPLGNVFNVFASAGNGCQTAYHLQAVSENWQYPQDKERTAAPAVSYQKITATLLNVFQMRSPQDMTLSEALQVVEETMSYVPSSTNSGEVPDISLYDHQKLTAAFAVCLWHVFQERAITDYQLYCYGKKQAALRRAPVYLLVSGDLSGIQKFIYTIPSKGALKSLRGRSLYLDILLEHVVDEILEACHVSRSCLLYTGGGHFYLLLPNTKAVQAVLQKTDHMINEWFLQHYGTQLYLALAFVSCSATEFSAAGGGAGQVFRRVSQELGKKKLCRYDASQLAALFDPYSTYNKDTGGMRECAVCHTASAAASLRPYGDADESGEEACESCNALFHLGKAALDGNIFAVMAKPAPQAVPMPGLTQTYYLQALKEEKMEAAVAPKRIYVKNELTLGKQVSTHLWMGDYIVRNAQQHAVEFTELARQSGGSCDSQGITRIGVLRADVDNLGAAFIAGFGSAYDTLSRKVSLSRNLSLFFKQYVKTLCQGKTADGLPGFTLFAGEVKKERKVHVIYSGGDDMFLAGTWDDILEIAVDLRRAFRKFTNGKLTFSAGIGFFYPSCPISQMARKTGDLEEYAKANTTHDKDSLALFGEVKTVQEADTAALTARYSWDEFEQGVCRDKLGFLERNITVRQDEAGSKLFVGKTALYRLLGLLRQAERDCDHIELARFAYTLARMQPKETEKGKWRCYQNLRSVLYDWYQSSKDRKELITAIELLIYHIRDKEVKG